MSSESAKMLPSEFNEEMTDLCNQGLLDSSAGRNKSVMKRKKKAKEQKGAARQPVRQENTTRTNENITDSFDANIQVPLDKEIQDDEPKLQHTNYVSDDCDCQRQISSTAETESTLSSLTRRKGSKKKVTFVKNRSSDADLDQLSDQTPKQIESSDYSDTMVPGNESEKRKVRTRRVVRIIRVKRVRRKGGEESEGSASDRMETKLLAIDSDTDGNSSENRIRNRKIRSEQRVNTINDLRQYMKHLEENGKPLEDMEKLLSASRPLISRVRDSAQESRLERIQSHNHEKTYGRKEREMLERKRTARTAKLRKKMMAQPEVQQALRDKVTGRCPVTGRYPVVRQCAVQRTLSLDSEGEETESGYSGYDSTSSVESDRKGGTRKSVPLLLNPEKQLKLIRKTAEKQLKQIDPKLKARVRKTEEIDKMLWIKVFLTCLIGVCTGVVVQFISFLSTQVLMNPKQSSVQAVLRKGDLLGGFALHAFLSSLLGVATVIIVVGLPGCLSKWYGGCPGARGSGLPEVKTYLNGALDKHRMQEPRTLVAKIFALSCLIASGVPASRDMIHVAALIASNVGAVWASRERFLERNKFISESFLSASDGPKFVLVSAGVAAGVGASFRCPFAGVIFSLEEFSVYWSKETASMCFLASGIASCFAWYFTGVDASGVWYLTNFEDTTGTFDPYTIRIIPAAFAKVNYPSLKVLELGMLVLLGVMGGLWGSLFTIINGYGLAALRKKYLMGKRMKEKRIAEMVAVAVFTSAVAVLLPALWPCRPRTPEEDSALFDKGQRISWKTSTCPPGYINEMASLCFQGQGTAMNNLYTESDDMQFSALVLFVYGAVYFVVTVVSVGTASPAGAVIPMVLSGAAWGRALGVVFNRTFDWEGNQHPHVRFYAIMGGAAALSGFMRMPLAITAMTVEITGNVVFTAPLFISCTVAKVVADRVAIGFISFMCRFNDYPVLRQRPPPAFYERTALDIMTELDRGVAYVPLMIGLNDSPDHAAWLLADTRHTAFPVVVDRETDWTLKGLIGRNQLQELVDENAENDADRFRRDLALEMQYSPVVVNESMPAYRVYMWFVSLGFRRLIVVKDGSLEVTGVITRHDLYEAFTNWK